MSKIAVLIISALDPELWEVRIESIFAFFLDPFIRRFSPFEEWMYRKTFERVNRKIEKDSSQISDEIT